MFEYIHTQHGREIYNAKYNEENYQVFYNPKSKKIEQILPTYQSGTSIVAKLFHRFIEEK